MNDEASRSSFPFYRQFQKQKKKKSQKKKRILKNENNLQSFFKTFSYTLKR